MKKYICPVGCKLDRSELKRFRIKGRQMLGCPVHKKHITHAELTCTCGVVMDISIQQAGLMEYCPDCGYARKIGGKLTRKKGGILRRSECIHYLECLGKLDFLKHKHTTPMDCRPCNRYKKRIDDPADYMGTGSDRPDILAPVGARTYPRHR